MMLQSLPLDQSSDSDTCLYQTLSDQSPCGSPGCLYGLSPSLRESAAGLAVSADASAPSLKSPAGADSSGPPLQVSEKERKAEQVKHIPVKQKRKGNQGDQCVWI